MYILKDQAVECSAVDCSVRQLDLGRGQEVGPHTDVLQQKKKNSLLHCHKSPEASLV